MEVPAVFGPTQRVLEALQRVPRGLLHDASTPLQQLGKLYLNLSALLGDQQVSATELNQIINVLLDGTALEDAAVEHEQQRQDTAGGAAPVPAQQQHTTAQPTNSARKLHGVLPWHTLSLSKQPLGTTGLQLVFQHLRRAKRLRALVAADCSISGCFTGDILSAMTSNPYMVPPWVTQLQWLDLSHNQQLQLLEPGDAAFAVFLDTAEELQGLCLQYTGVTTVQLISLFDLINMLLTDDSLADQQPVNTPHGDIVRKPLRNLQCLKLGPILPGPDNNRTAAGPAQHASSSNAGWPAAAFDDLHRRLANFEPPMNQLLVLELYGLNQQQQQKLHEWVGQVSTLLTNQPGARQDVMYNPYAQDKPDISQPQPDCCRISWLKLGDKLEFEVPVKGLEWQLPPQRPAVRQPPDVQAPSAAAGAAGEAAAVPAAPFAMPAGAAAAEAAPAATGWTRVPAAVAAAASSRQQHQQAAAQRHPNPAAGAVGSRNVLDAFRDPGGVPGPLPTHYNSSASRPRTHLTSVGPHAQPSSKHRDRQQQDRQPGPRPVQQQQHQQQQRRRREKCRRMRQQGMADYVNPLTAGDDAAEGYDYTLEQQQQYVVSDEDDFMQDPQEPGSSRHLQQRQRRQRCATQAAAAGSNADEGMYIGSEDSEDAAAAAGGPDGAGRGVLAGLLRQHRDDIFTDSDSEHHNASGTADFPGSMADLFAEDGAPQQQQQQQPKKRRRQMHTLQPILFNQDDHRSPQAGAAAAAGPGSSPVATYGLAPLESPLSPASGSHDSPASQHRQRGGSWHADRASPAAAAQSDHSDHDADDQSKVSQEQRSGDPDADLDKWLAADDEDEQNLAHGMHSQDEASQGSGSQQGGSQDGQQQQQQRRRRRSQKGDDDDPEGLRAFAFEHTKRPGQGLGPKGEQIFGIAKEGEKRRQKAAGMDDKVRERLQQLRSRYELQQMQQTQPSGLQGEQGGTSAAAAAAAAAENGSQLAGKHSQRSSKQHKHRRSGVSRFVDDAAGGGGRFGYEEEQISSSSSDGGGSSSDGSGSSDDDHQLRANKAGNPGRSSNRVAAETRPVTTASHGRKSRGVVITDSEPQDEHDLRLQQHLKQQQQLPPSAAGAQRHTSGDFSPAATAAAGRRSRAAVIVDSEPQDELDLLLQQHLEQQQQQQPVAAGKQQATTDESLAILTAAAGSSRRKIRAATLVESEPLDELELDMLQQQQREHDHDAAAGASAVPNSSAELNAAAAAAAVPGMNPSKQQNSSCRQQQQQKRRQRQIDKAPRQHAAAEHLSAANATALPIAGQQQQQEPCAAAVAADTHTNEDNDSGSEQAEDLDSIPEYRKWQEAERELRQLQETEKQLQQRLAAAQTAAAAAAAAATVVVDATDTGLIRPSAVVDSAAAAGAATADAAAVNQTAAAAAKAGETPSAAAAAATEAVESINSIKQQLRVVNAERLKKQRLVRLLKDAVPYSWDKQGTEARAFKQMNQPKASKRQSRAPTRLSPGAIEEQQRLLRLAQQQQQHGEAFPVSTATAAGAPGKHATGAKAAVKASGIQKLHRPPANRFGGGQHSSSSGSEGGNGSSSSSEDDDDVPLATVLRRKPRPSNAAAAADVANAVRDGHVHSSNDGSSSEDGSSSSSSEDDDQPIAVRMRKAPVTQLPAAAAAAAAATQLAPNPQEPTPEASINVDKGCPVATAAIDSADAPYEDADMAAAAAAAAAATPETGAQKGHACGAATGQGCSISMERRCEPASAVADNSGNPSSMRACGASKTAAAAGVMAAAEQAPSVMVAGAAVKAVRGAAAPAAGAVAAASVSAASTVAQTARHAQALPLGLGGSFCEVLRQEQQQLQQQQQQQAQSDAAGAVDKPYPLLGGSAGASASAGLDSGSRRDTSALMPGTRSCPYDGIPLGEYQQQQQHRQEEQIASQATLALVSEAVLPHLSAEASASPSAALAATGAPAPSSNTTPVVAASTATAAAEQAGSAAVAAAAAGATKMHQLMWPGCASPDAAAAAAWDAASDLQEMEIPDSEDGDC